MVTFQPVSNARLAAGDFAVLYCDTEYIFCTKYQHAILHYWFLDITYDDLWTPNIATI